MDSASCSDQDNSGDNSAFSSDDMAMKSFHGCCRTGFSQSNNLLTGNHLSASYSPAVVEVQFLGAAADLGPSFQRNNKKGGHKNLRWFARSSRLSLIMSPFLSQFSFVLPDWPHSLCFLWRLSGSSSQVFVLRH